MCPGSCVLVAVSFPPHRDPVFCLQQLARGLALPHPQATNLVMVLSTYTVLFTLYLNTLHDAEFYREREGERERARLGLRARARASARATGREKVEES